jgi:hypothetical protein
VQPGFSHRSYHGLRIDSLVLWLAFVDEGRNVMKEAVFFFLCCYLGGALSFFQC